MFIELVGSLRCLRPHEPAWLVASAYRMEDRDIVSGELGCPVCQTRYPIEYGVADLRDGRPSAGPAAADPDRSLAVRAAAWLDLTSPGGLVVLAGSWATAAHEMGGVVEGVHVLGLDAPAEIRSGLGVSLALTADELPLRAMAARGIALDAAHATPRWVESAAEALRPGGRILGPAGAPLPPALAEVARNARWWIATRTAGVSVPLRRGTPGAR